VLIYGWVKMLLAALKDALKVREKHWQ
jgi:hypothetical protein